MPLEDKERPDMTAEPARSHERHPDRPEKKDKRKNLFIKLRFQLPAFPEGKTVRERLMGIDV
jgi:hypothetical protein